LETLIAPAGEHPLSAPYVHKPMNFLNEKKCQKADFGLKNYRPYNRGNKLKKVVQESETVVPGRPSILPLASTNEQFEVLLSYFNSKLPNLSLCQKQLSYIGKKRAILQKVFSKKEFKDDLTSARHLIEDDPYLDVHIEGNF
jgi:hypothetical protein